MNTPNDETDVIREHLERYRTVTLQTLALVTDEKLPWKPSDGVRSFAEQFMHIAQTEDFYTQGLFRSDWNMARYARPATELTREALQSKFAETRAFTLARLAEVDPNSLSETKTVPGIPVP